MQSKAIILDQVTRSMRRIEEKNDSYTQRWNGIRVLEGPEVVFSRNIIGIFTRKCVSTYIKQTEYYLNADLFVSISNEES